MRLRKNKDNQLEFKKKIEKDIHSFNFQKFIKFVIADCLENQDSSSEDESEND